MRRGLKPRSVGQYSNATHGGGRANIPMVDRTINREVARVNMLVPNQKGPLICRPLNSLRYDDPTQLSRGRDSITAHAQNDWGVLVPTTSYSGVRGCGQVSFARHDPFLATKRPELEADNPYVVLYRTAMATSKAWKKNMAGDSPWNPALNALVERGATSGAPLSRPDDKGYFAAAVYAHGDRKYLDGSPLGLGDSDDLTIVTIPFGCWRNLLDLLDKPATIRQLAARAGIAVPPNPAQTVLDRIEREAMDLLDFENNPQLAFYFGDPVGVPSADGLTVDGGVIFTIFYPKQVSVSDCQAQGPRFGQKMVNIPNGQKFWLEDTTWDGTIDPNIAPGYQIAISRDTMLDGRKIVATLTPPQVQHIKDTWQFWWDDPSGDPDMRGLIQVLPLKEQLKMIATAFAAYPMLLRFCWSGRKDFLIPEVEQILADYAARSKPGTDEERQDETNYAGATQQAGTRGLDPVMAGRSGMPSDSFDEQAAAAPGDAPPAEDFVPEPQEEPGDMQDVPGEATGEAAGEATGEDVLGDLGDELAAAPADGTVEEPPLEEVPVDEQTGDAGEGAVEEQAGDPTGADAGEPDPESYFSELQQPTDELDSPPADDGGGMPPDNEDVGDVPAEEPVAPPPPPARRRAVTPPPQPAAAAAKVATATRAPAAAKAPATPVAATGKPPAAATRPAAAAARPAAAAGTTKPAAVAAAPATRQAPAARQAPATAKPPATTAAPAAAPAGAQTVAQRQQQAGTNVRAAADAAKARAAKRTNPAAAAAPPVAPPAAAAPAAVRRK